MAITRNIYLLLKEISKFIYLHGIAKFPMIYDVLKENINRRVFNSKNYYPDFILNRILPIIVFFVSKIKFRGFFFFESRFKKYYSSKIISAILLEPATANY